MVAQFLQNTSVIIDKFCSEKQSVDRLKVFTKYGFIIYKGKL